MPQDSKIDVAVAEPDAVVTGVLRLPVKLLQVEVLLVELGGARRILARDSNVPDESHGLFLLQFRYVRSKRNFRPTLAVGVASDYDRPPAIVGRANRRGQGSRVREEFQTAP